MHLALSIALTFFCAVVLLQTRGWLMEAHICSFCGTRTGEHDKNCPWNQGS